MTQTEREAATAKRVADCDNHNITRDGLFFVMCRDKTGVFTAGMLGLSSATPRPLADAVKIAKHMAGYGFTIKHSMPPGILLPSEMTIMRALPSEMK